MGDENDNTSHQFFHVLNNAGIDAQQGIARLGGKRDLFVHLLYKFAHNYAHIIEEIRHLLVQGEREEAMRHAHSLKGVAGNLGAQALMESFTSLEDALREQSPEEAQYLDQTEHILQQVLQGIAQLPTT